MTNFKEMSLKELRKYVLANRQDQEAWDEFVSRPRPNAITVPADTPLEEQERILRDAINRNRKAEG